MKNLNGKTAAITGAASGIGKMLALLLASEHCNLAIADKDGKGLKETAAMTGDAVNVSTHIIDVANRKQMEGFAKKAASIHGGVDIIINNAGVALGDFLETVPIKDFEWIMGINFWGVVYGTMAFLPFLKKRPEGHIVNISSIYGILPSPNTGPYSASKFAVRGYTETLSQELRGTAVRVSVVHPGGIKTNIVRNTRVNRTLYSLSKEQAVSLYDDELFKTTAEKAAKIIISGIKRNKKRILIGTDAKILDLMARLFPVTAVTISAIATNYLAKSYAMKK